MKLLFIVLNKTECLEALLKEFGDKDISGATIIDSKGMIQELSDREDFMLIGSLRSLLNPTHKENKTIFMVTDDEKVKACLCVKDAGADFVKTSTGFFGGGATAHDVRLMRSTVGEGMGVKASGGIRDYAAAVEMLKAGANRLGTSSGVAIAKML